jgi:glycosyltransferase involved in cell wall biosynthesis
MKIALGLEYPLALRGGVSVLVEKLIEGLASSHEVVLVSADAPGFEQRGACAHVHWNPLTVSRRTSRELAERLSELGVSLAHFHAGGTYGWGNRFPGRSPFPFLRQKGIACVSTIHMAVSILDGYCDAAKPTWFKLGLFPAAWLGKLDALRNVEAEIVISQRAYERVRRWYWPMRQRFRWLYHSRLPATESAPGAAAREPLVLCVGHIALRKGQHTLAAAFAQLAPAHPGWKLLILGPAGEDDCWAQIQATIAAHKLQERILLPGSRDDAMDFMRRAAIFVQPSLFEGLPLALQEAMFCGCACVATRVMGNDELIEDGRTGLLVPPLEARPMAEALEVLMRDATRREALGRAAAASVLEKGMTAAEMTERHITLYESILAARRPQTETMKKAATLSSHD